MKKSRGSGCTPDGCYFSGGGCWQGDRGPVARSGRTPEAGAPRPTSSRVRASPGSPRTGASVTKGPQERAGGGQRRRGDPDGTCPKNESSENGQRLECTALVKSVWLSRKPRVSGKTMDLPCESGETDRVAHSVSAWCPLSSADCGGGAPP